MAQIWLFVILSVILRLSGAFGESLIYSNEDEDHAYYNSLHRGRVVLGDNRCPRSANPPIFYESCFYPYNDDVSRGCHSYVLFGDRTKEDKLLFKQEYKKKELTPTKLIIKPDLKNVDFKKIRFVAVDDLNGSECVHKDKVCVTKGGIGKTFIQIVIENGRCNTRGYKVSIYGI